ncbi:MAG TPA: cytochrome C biogenesis protein [Sediminispirochaeta sp.]|nr:cytochrome C biogenesis protein [Sediminispirochaeta sp.]
MVSSLAFLIVVVLLIAQIRKLFRRSQLTYEVEGVLMLLASVLLFVDFVYRSFLISFPALTNTYEALVFFSSMICLLLFFQARRIPSVPVGREIDDTESGRRFILFVGTVVVFIFLALSSSPLVPSTVQPPVPALQSYWLVAHVVLSFAGEAFFVLAFAAALGYFRAKSEEGRNRADRLSYTSILVGYFLFSVGALVFGMIWAEQAWGSYWSWDPKETWALITWLTYTLYLHVRLVMKRKGRLTAILAILGFLLTMFTFFGVNYLMPGLHSYV